MPPLTLTPDELAALTGYRQAAKQLEQQTADYIDGRVTPMTKATR